MVNDVENKDSLLVEVASKKFLEKVESQFVAELSSGTNFTDYEKILAQHMFIKLDSYLKDADKDRSKDAVPYTWDNINLNKLAIDTVHRVNLGLDALVSNHIHPIAYLNGKTKKYDVDLRIGYVGKIYCRCQMATEPPEDVVIERVYENDHFTPIKKGLHQPYDSYAFEIENPFNRGKIVGGFGYLNYANKAKNKLIIVTKRDIDKAQACAKTQKFWADDKFYEEMVYKTLVHRVADKIEMDPRKINARSYVFCETQSAEDELKREMNENANKKVINITPEKEREEPVQISRPMPKIEVSQNEIQNETAIHMESAPQPQMKMEF